MTRARRPGDWDRDLSAARHVEALVGAALAADRRIVEFADRTDTFELDFAFRYGQYRVSVDVKEKRQSYSAGITQLLPQVEERHLFVIDETVFRRVVWQGGGGYLLVHDLPAERWVVFGPWELTLAPRLRYGRWGAKEGRPAFLKGKLLIDLRTGAAESTELCVELLLETIRSAGRWRDRPEPYPIHGARLRELGSP